jgi:hypothetical protein
MMKSMQSSIDQMTTPNPAVMQRIRQTQMDGDQARQDEVNYQQATEEQRQQKAARDAEAARMKQLNELAGALQGLPGNTNTGLDLRPGGTPFFGTGGPGAAPRPGSNIEALRAAGSSGFDTRGPLAGELQAPPPPASPPSPVVLQEKPVPPDKRTPEMQAQLKERDELRAHKKEMQDSLGRLESKGQLTPEESAAMEKLRQDLATTLNKENFLTFSINESLP